MSRNRLKRTAAWMISAWLAVCALAGCGSSAGSSSTDASGETMDESEMIEGGSSSGGSMVIGTGQSCTTLDPVQNYDGWYTVRFGVGQTLTKLEDDLSISGWLVEDDYSVSEDGLTWTFTVKDGITFSNGKELTAEAVKLSIENVFENGTRGPEYFTYESIEADGQTLTITTEEMCAILPNMLSDPLFVIIDTEEDLTNIADDGPVATGPYVFDSFDLTTKEVHVVRNENYWGDTPGLDEVTFIYSEDQTTLTMSMQSGEFDAVYNISMTDVEQFEDNAEYAVVTAESGRTAHGFMNQNGALGDEKLRQALMRYIDKETYCETLLSGQYVPGITPLTSASQYGYDELTDINAYDPEGAVTLLDEAGYVDIDNDGYRETPEGEQLDLRFVYYTGRPEQQILVEAMQSEFMKIGIRITPEVHDTQTVIDMLAGGDYDLLCMSINALNCGDPESHFTAYFSTDGSQNGSGYSSEEFDAVLEELSMTTDADGRVELVKEAEQILMDDSVCIYFCYPIMNFVTKSNVTGINSTPADFYWLTEETAFVS